MSSPTYASPRRTGREGRTGRYQALCRHPQGRPVCTPYHTVQRIGQRSVCSQIRCRLHRQEFQKMDVDLRRIVSDNFGFGDFIFRNPDTLEEIARVKNLKELQNILFCCSGRIIPLPSAATTSAAGSTHVPCFPWQSSCGHHLE